MMTESIINMIVGCEHIIGNPHLIISDWHPTDTTADPAEIYPTSPDSKMDTQEYNEWMYDMVGHRHIII